MYIMCLSKGLSAIESAIDKGLLPNKTLAFVPTAGDTYENPYFVEESKQSLQRHGLSLVELDVAHELRTELVSKLEICDGIYVAGGNTFYLLQQLIQKDLLNVIREKVVGGMSYFGESAGAVLLAKSIEAAKSIDNPEDAPGLTTYEGLGLIDFFPLPHVGREKYKAVFDKFIGDNSSTLNIVQYTDEQAIVTEDGNAYEIFDSAIEEI